MSPTIRTEHENELILVEDVLDPAGRAVVALGMITADGSDTFPGRTLTPEQAEELAASLARSAAAARANARLAPAPLPDEHAHEQTLEAIRAAVPLARASPTVADDQASGLEALPIADYDQLKASAIIKQLAGLSAAQLSVVLAHEQSHRNRKSIRKSITALRSAPSRTDPTA
jgi:hypothetical protein